MTKAELDDHLQNGCAWCEEEFICPEDRYAWLDKAKPICAKCLDGHEERLDLVSNKNLVN